ncbi:MAG: mechanosensitive ion channel family protein [Candidatus Omnitrophica bacterium]|nr:mechanosensitive ion channel family protein [Candidatus Omnitrophota bacterium]MBU1852691.1 mechanosensitive ion channel family protein [Candidatus Omnitrophota bacterium]
MLIENKLLVRLIGTIVILLAVIIIRKIINIALSRFQKHVDKKDTSGASSVETRVAIIKKIINSGIYFFAFIFFLLQFEAVRSVGTGLLASAGLAGIIIGMAAQSTVSNFISGIYVSFAQPVKLNDAVIFENDFGWIEEINLMHTVIRTWDNRRIVAPNSVLAGKVIQNWTMKDESLLGVVMMYVDYTCDVDKIKSWVKEIVDSSPYSTEERVSGVQVVDFTEKTMVLRILGKGPDAPNTWNLRCEIREKLIAKFKQAGLPLPLIRINSEKDPIHK